MFFCPYIFRERGYVSLWKESLTKGAGHVNSVSLLSLLGQTRIFPLAELINVLNIANAKFPFFADQIESISSYASSERSRPRHPLSGRRVGASGQTGRMQCDRRTFLSVCISAITRPPIVRRCLALPSQVGLSSTYRWQASEYDAPCVRHEQKRTSQSEPVSR